MHDQCVISIVSHGQSTMCNLLVRDLLEHCTDTFSELVITHNISEPDCDPNLIDQLVDSNRHKYTHIKNIRVLGFGANHNQAFKAAKKPDYFLILNPDLRFDSDAIKPMIEAMQNNSELGLVAPKVLEQDGRLANSARNLYTPLEIFSHRDQSRQVKTLLKPAWFAGMCLLVRGAAMRQIGGFDERFFLYGEDFDLCARMRLAGWQIAQVPTASVVHHAQRQSHKDLRFLRWHLRSMMRIWSSPVFWRYKRLLSHAK